jgi:hypothetical protein
MVLDEYVGYYNSARPNQGIDQQCPIPIPTFEQSGIVKRKRILSGMINDYFHDVA